MEAVATGAQTKLAAFWAYQIRRGRSENTRIKYAVYLEPFVLWVGDRDLGLVTAQEIELEWLNQWFADFQQRNGKVPSSKTVANHITALKSFFQFLERFDYVMRNPMNRIDSPKIEPKVNDWLKPHEDDALLRACQSPQERIVVPLLRFAGLRVGEAENLLKSDVDLDAGTITVRVSKTPRGRRVIPILPELQPHIERWLWYQTKDGFGAPSTPFLATRTGKAMQPKQIWGTVKRVAIKAQVRTHTARDNEGVNGSEVSPHTLRRTFGSWLINRHVRLEVVSRLLGHESTVTTERAYASLLDQTIASEVLAALS